MTTEIIPQPTKKQPKLQKKTLDAIRYVDAGLDAKEALQAVNLKSNISREAVSKFKEKYKKYQLNNDSTARLAGSQIKRILKALAREESRRKVTKDGEVIEYTDNIYPTDSNILAAAAMVYDRYEPVQGSQGADNQDHHPINIQVFVNNPVYNSSYQPQSIDVLCHNKHISEVTMRDDKDND